MTQKAEFTDPHRQTNRKISKRLVAFDRRFTKRGDLGGDSSSTLGDSIRFNPKSPTFSPVATDAGTREAEHKGLGETLGSPFGADKEGDVYEAVSDASEALIPFVVVRWSSQNQIYPAKSLASEKGGAGMWQAVGSLMRNEYVTLELADKRPQTVCSLSMVLPGNECSPRRCKVHYSTKSPEGPWREAWSFEVPKEVKQFKTIANFDEIIDDFRETLLRLFPVGLEEAWDQVFDPGGVGKLCMADFVSACAKLQKMKGVTRNARWADDVPRLFEALEGSQSEGAITVADLQKESVRPPSAAWWRLTINGNWGSPKSLQILAPLRLYREVQATNEDQRNVLDQLSFHSGGQALDVTMAFDLQALGVDPLRLKLRRLAKEFQLSMATVDEIYEYFQEVDADASGSIERDEFDSLMLKLHGTNSFSDIPPGRLNFFWKQADTDGSGHVEFEEFLVWFQRNFHMDGPSSPRLARSGQILTNYYWNVRPHPKRDFPVPTA